MNYKNVYVSVVIPTWNGKDLIKNCLASLMKQTYKDFEIIVTDNGSTAAILMMKISFYFILFNSSFGKID